ncbi:MAG: hypothetical protein V1649_00485 [Patescibacteria group bacterium]
MKKFILFLFSVLFFLFLVSSAIEAGGINSRVKAVNRERGGETVEEELLRTKPPTPPPKEFEVVVMEGSIFPSIENTGYTWPKAVSLTFAVLEKGTNKFVSLPKGTKVYFKILYSSDGITWDEDEDSNIGEDILVYPPDSPYIIPFETSKVTFIGSQIVSKVGNGGISVGGTDRYCLWIKIKEEN